MSDFIPCTSPRSIGDGIFFRPIRSWHSGTYAGEKLYKIPGSNDGSGCLFSEKLSDVLPVCSPPHTVTHRLYWHEKDPNQTISAFLSYPNGMGVCDEYFWEANKVEDDNDITRYFGPDAETEMEAAIKAYLLAQVEASQ